MVEPGLKPGQSVSKFEVLNSCIPWPLYLGYLRQASSSLDLSMPMKRRGSMMLAGTRDKANTCEPRQRRRNGPLK